MKITYLYNLVAAKLYFVQYGMIEKLWHGLCKQNAVPFVVVFRQPYIFGSPEHLAFLRYKVLTTDRQCNV